METHSSILPGESPWTEEPGGLQSMELQRFRHNWANFRHNRAIFTHTYFSKLRKKIEKEKRNLTPDGDASAWCKLPHGNNTAFSHKNIFQDSIDFYKIKYPFLLPFLYFFQPYRKNCLRNSLSCLPYWSSQLDFLLFRARNDTIHHLVFPSPHCLPQH